MAEIKLVVLKINGTDISQMPEDTVVEMFLTAGEPLLVEMHRKSSIKKNDCNDVNDKMAEMTIAPTGKPKTRESVQVDADLTSTIKLVVAIKSSEVTAALEIASRASKLTQTDNSYFIYDNSKERAEHFMEHEHNLLEQCLAPEIDIEEITLRKSDSNERLGLIVCYNGCLNNGENNGAISSSDDYDACTEVYISGIQPDSVAGRDGRLRQGDQILQINGKDIKNKEETELLIAENNNAVTLLVSRYLFTDEDDFNDPLLADLEVDEDDVEEEELDSNITYENCLLQNEPANELEEALALHSESKPKKLQTPAIESQQSTTAAVSYVGTITSSSSVQICADIVGSPERKVFFVSPQSTTSPSAAGNEKILNHLQYQHAPHQNRKMHQNVVKKILRSHKAEQPSWTLPSPFDSVKNDLSEQHPQHINYDTEHIYETIPEDSESEPFYCSPYESSTYVAAFGFCSSNATDTPQLQKQKNNVAKWLDVCANPMNMPQLNAISASARSSNAGSRQQLHSDANESVTRMKSNTVRSTLTTITNGSSSSGASGNSGGSNIADVSQNEERDYSSSAYNTGDSNNSTIPLLSVHNQSGKCNVVLDDSKTQKLQLPKDKTSCILSKTGCDDLPQLSQTIRSNIESSADVWTKPPVSETLEDQNKYTTKHLCNNDPIQSQLGKKNICRDLVSKHHLHPVLTQDNIFHHQNLFCPQFVAPNLSQYHFVSSQEVRTGIQQTTTVTPRVEAVNHKSLPKEETMVWKVKRRQDGTRYIVRRPARNRCLLRDRSIRMNTDNVRNKDMSTTTEEDNISEVKPGRYWSKEERRKHIERARERKQQHQLQQQQIIDANNLSKVFVKDQSFLKLFPQKKDGLIQQQRTNQHRFTDHSGNQTQETIIATALQQHYQLQFNSSRMQHQKETRMVGEYESKTTTCAHNVSCNEKQTMPTKEPALEACGTEVCRISAPATEIGPVITTSNGEGFSSSLVEGSELQNCISITTV